MLLEKGTNEDKIKKKFIEQFMILIKNKEKKDK
jgi:hypothetical protein